jgi:diguanylate cyclase (GGDEF)-like protein
MKKSYLFALFGFSLGTGAPLGILFLRCLSTSLPLTTFLKQEASDYAYFYIYMLIGTCLVFALFGFFMGRTADRLIRKDVVLAKEVLTDPLTGLGNHRFLHDTFKIEFRRHITSRLPISCLMLDLDHFKRINDTYGHPFGDYVLKHFAMILRKSVREGDTVARYGGEEFLCVLPNCDKDQLRIVAERIRKATQRHLFMQKNHRVQLTVSLGAVTSYESSGLNYRHLIALADRALYEAKGKGRNRLIQTTIRMAKKFTRRKASTAYRQIH